MHNGYIVGKTLHCHQLQEIGELSSKTESHKTTDIRLSYDKLRFSIFAHATQYFTMEIKLHVVVILAKTKFLVIGKMCANVFTNNSVDEEMGVKVFEMGLNVFTNFGQKIYCRQLGS